MLAARGNAFTTPETVQKLLLHKAAEMAVASGFEWFFFEGTQDVSQQGVFVSPAFGNAYACEFRRYSATDSNRIRPPVPMGFGH
jgi:hypothetical protein